MAIDYFEPVAGEEKDTPTSLKELLADFAVNHGLMREDLYRERRYLLEQRLKRNRDAKRITWREWQDLHDMLPKEYQATNSNSEQKMHFIRAVGRWAIRKCKTLFGSGDKNIEEQKNVPSQVP